MFASSQPVRADTVATGFTFLEGPRWRDGSLYASDFYSERVLRFEPTGQFEVVCTVPGRPSGLGFAPDGTLLIVSMLERTLKRWDGRELTTVASFGHLVHGYANDMIVTDEGWALIGDFGNTDDEPDSMTETGLVRVSPAGEVDLVAPGLVFPNGMVITPDGGEFIVAETFAGRLSAYDYSTGPDGRPLLEARRTWKQFGTAPDYLDIGRASVELAALPDGLAIDADGNVWVASSNTHEAVLVTPSGDILSSVDVGDLSAYSLALGGDDGRTLFLCCGPSLGESDPATSSDSVLMAARVTVPGAHLERTPS